MRWLIAGLFACVSVSTLTAQDPSKEEKEEGFLSLFNGKDFSGFRFFGGKESKDAPKNWVIADGAIRVTGGGSPHLATQWEFDDFDARFQWKAHKAGYNSGFFVRTGRDKGVNQINLAQKSAGNLMTFPGAPAVPDLQKEPGQWNEWRVLAEGSKLTFWANGKKAWEVSGIKATRGYLGWQAEGAAIDFKNIRVKELGFTSMNDPKQWKDSEGWTVEDGAWKKGPKARAIITPKRYNNFVLRMEWRDGFKPFTQVEFGGGRPAKLHMAIEDLRKVANPPGEWNYLEVMVKDRKGTVWMNGHTVMKDERLEKDTVPGPILLIPGEHEVAFRNLRIKVLPD